MASLASKITLVISCAASLGIVAYVHFKQVDDRKQLHLGIDRDLERQSKKKASNMHALVQQDELTKAYRRAQEAEVKDQVS